MQSIAAALGKITDSVNYAAAMSKLLAFFESEFFTDINGTYTYGSGSQASNAIALDMGVVPVEYIDVVTQNIVDSITEAGNHLSVGEIALPSLFRALQAQGQNDIIYKMVTNPTSPSYAYQVIHGATSLTERWDGPTASCGGCNSLNHFMLGYADQWLYELSGLSQAKNSTTWSIITFSPIFVTNMTWAFSSYRSLRGMASADWTLSNSSLTYKIEVPVGATGQVSLNLYRFGFSKLQESKRTLYNTTIGDGISNVQLFNGTFNVTVGSGNYTFLAFHKS